MQNETIDVKVTPYTDGRIELESSIVDSEGRRQELLKGIIDTQEELTHKALVALGWTPPEGEAPIVADTAMLVDAICGKGFKDEKHHRECIVYGYADKDGWLRDKLATFSLRRLLAIYAKET